MVYADTFDNPRKEPVNQSSVFSFTPSRQDNRVTFRCEAHLDLWPIGPQLYTSSQEHNITVYCKYIMCTHQSEMFIQTSQF